MAIQKTIGSDIVMVFDECSPYPCERSGVESALARTHSWARICRDYELGKDQNLFGIVQGGTFADLRRESAEALAKMDFEGYAIGGLSVGEPMELMYEMIDATEPFLPKEKPRYLMGVGTPRNIIEAVMRGIDMFDCVMPREMPEMEQLLHGLERFRLRQPGMPMTLVLWILRLTVTPRNFRAPICAI
jgi:queuine tRNA-ribosyltransferase